MTINRPSSSSPSLSAEWERILQAFREFQRTHRGVRERSLIRHIALLRRFLGHASSKAPVGIDGISIRHVDDFLIDRGRLLSRHGARGAASMVRTFLRYLALLGHAPGELADQVPRVRTYRLAGLPRGIEQDHLQLVLGSAVPTDARGRRERAILILLATYGLRAGDVGALRLDDLRWRDGTIAIRTSKTGHFLVLPLTDAVGNAIADYLRLDRPRSDHREVFLSLCPPVRPLCRDRITFIVQRALEGVGIARRKGLATRSFRHAFATRLIRNRVPLATIASCLGHADTRSTMIYAKLDVEDLRTVSLDPREVLP